MFRLVEAPRKKIRWLINPVGGQFVGLPISRDDLPLPMIVSYILCLGPRPATEPKPHKAILTNVFRYPRSTGLNRQVFRVPPCVSTWF